MERGVCPNCKCRPLKPGYRECETCKAATARWAKENSVERAEYLKKRYDDLKSQGLCVTCTLPTGGNVFCRTCTDRAVARRALKQGRHSRNRWAKRGM